jgi:hypothetical protein
MVEGLVESMRGAGPQLMRDRTAMSIRVAISQYTYTHSEPLKLIS